tara:strand:+ start:886 stop:1290 length:405 start_codon:yes stop_codon:yes gene_type:complete
MAKITYIKDGQSSTSQLIIDGVQVDSSNYNVASNIHAIQWVGSKGSIEYNDGTVNEDITDISSYDFETKHAKEKKANEATKDQAEADRIANMTYAEKRKEAYPVIDEQLDDIYHNGIDAWKATIKVIKDKYPKG